MYVESAVNNGIITEIGRKASTGPFALPSASAQFHKMDAVCWFRRFGEMMRCFAKKTLIYI
jgi:hypothetical protein